MRKSSCFFLFLLLSLHFSSVQSQSDLQWEFHPSLYRAQAILETEDELWITFGTSVLQINLATRVTALHTHQSIQADTKTESDFSNANLHGLWQDKNGEINVFLDQSTGYISWDGSRWEFHPLNMPFLEVISFPKVIRQDEEDNLVISDGKYGLYGWNPHINPNEVVLLYETIDIQHYSYTYDNTGRLWAYYIFGDEQIFRQDESLVDEIKIPNPNGEYESFVSTQITIDGEIWAWKRDGVYYFSVDDQWLHLPFDIGNDSHHPYKLLPLTANKAYIINQGKTFLLEVINNQLVATELTVLSNGTIRINSLLAATENGDLYYLGGSDNSLWCKRQDDELPEQVAKLEAVITPFIDLAVDSRGEVWGVDYNDAYFFAGGRWQRVERLFPGMPINQKSITVDQTYAPVITHKTSGSEYEVYQWGNAQWMQLVSDEDDTNSTLVLRHETYTDHRGRIWIVDDLGFNRWEYSRWSRENLGDYFPRVSTRINDFFVDEKNRVFITADRQFIVKDGGYYESYSREALGFDNTIDNSYSSGLRADIDEQGNVYISHNLELRKWTNEGTTAFYPFDAIYENPNSVDSVLYGVNEIFSFAPDDIWLVFSKAGIALPGDVGYNTGIAHFDGEDWRAFYPDDSPLASSLIFDIVKDASGRIWIATSKGLNVITRSDSPQVKPYELLHPNLLNIYPNPGCCVFQLHWEQASPGRVTINLLNVQGLLIKEITNGYFPAGEQSWSFTREKILAGTYLVQVVTEEKTFIEKVIIL